jgi:hypothetical protein
MLKDFLRKQAKKSEIVIVDIGRECDKTSIIFYVAGNCGT